MTNIFPTDFIEKTTPADDDKILLSDSADADKIKYGLYSKFKGAKGDAGDPGTPGTPGTDGTDGTDGNGIASITTNKVGKTTTVTITEDDSTITTFDVEDGEDGTGSGTVTSVAALTLGTTGTDLSSTVANGTSTPVITLNVPTASAANRGALSSTDWSTFNGKQSALTKAAGSDVDTGTDDDKYVTSKAIADSKLSYTDSPTFTGTVTMPTMQLGETSIKLDETLSGNGTWSGITVAGTGGETLAFGDLCYFKAADSKRYKVDGILDGTDVGFSKQLGMCVLAGASTTTEILLYGKIYATAFPTLTIGAPAYIDDTAGAIIVAQPSTTNFAIRVVGYGLTADILMFNPSPDYLVHV